MSGTNTEEVLSCDLERHIDLLNALLKRYDIAPGTEAMEQDWPAPEEEVERANPFAALAALKDKRTE